MASLISLPSSIEKRTFYKCTLIFAVLSILIYGKSVMNKYSMDDEYVILNNKQVHGGIKNISQIFRSSYSIESKASYEYRPIVKALYAIEYQIFGENPHISHFINILIYVLCVTLLFYVLLRLIPQRNYLFAFFVTLLFLVHPLHSEVVMSLKNRDALLSFTGALLSLLFYLRFEENKGLINLFGGLFFFLFAIMSKKDAIPFFVVIPFTLWFFRDIKWKKMLLVVVSFIPVILVFRIAAKSVKNEVIRTLLLWENPLFIQSTFFERIPQGFYSIYFYLKMFLIPHPLISYYGYNQVPIVGWNNIIVWLVILCMIVTTYFVIRYKAFRSIWFYGILFFLITISMFCNVVVPVVGIVGERFAFIPSIGLCIAAVYGLTVYFKIPIENLSFKFKTISNSFWITFGLILLLFSGKTFSRNQAWKDAFTLYSTDVKTATESAHTHSLLAAAAISKVRSEKRLSPKEQRELILLSKKHYLESIRIIPDYTSSHNNLGMVYYMYLKNNEQALKHLTKAIELDSGYVEACFNLATVYTTLMQYDKAEKYYLKTIELNPKFTNSYLSLSNLYAMNKEYDKIISLNQKAIDKKIKTDVIYINIGNVYFMNGDTLKALPYLETAISYNPNNRGVNAFLAMYYQAKGDQKKYTYYKELENRSAR
ncbi:MAG: tetratricopeptide repeat protein [Bacteroidetes bacterium]|jgi:tetratricopeptide (TPR) repeat protein|nr:tetratricopeptide repeat protein [Bacteroidota bacterium]